MKKKAESPSAVKTDLQKRPFSDQGRFNMNSQISAPTILIIKHGALGDFIQSFPSFEAVRKACPMARITLLCGPSLAQLARLSPYFDDIIIDQRERPGLSWDKWKKLRALTRKIESFDLVIDLQQSLRSKLYRVVSGHWKKPFSFKDFRKNKPCHTLMRQRRILEELHIPPVPPQKASWLIHEGRLSLPEIKKTEKPYVILAVETGKKHLYKSWPIQNFIQLAILLAQEGFQPVLTGVHPTSQQSRQWLEKRNILDLRGRTNLADLAKIMSQAALAIGADTGTMHLAPFCDCPVLVLFSDFSDPRFHTPIPLKSGDVTSLQARDTASLSFRKVFQTALHLLKKLG